MSFLSSSWIGKQIVYRFAGIRPLPAPRGHRPGIRVTRLPHRSGPQQRPAHRQPRRGKMDDVPCPGRCVVRTGSRRTRPSALRLNGRTADRRWPRVPEDGPRTTGLDPDALVRCREPRGRTAQALRAHGLPRYGSSSRPERTLPSQEPRCPPESWNGWSSGRSVVRLADVALRRTSLAFTGDVDLTVRRNSPMRWPLCSTGTMSGVMPKSKRPEGSSTTLTGCRYPQLPVAERRRTVGLATEFPHKPRRQ